MAPVAARWVAGVARNLVGWACLTGHRVAQDGDTPLHLVSWSGDADRMRTLLAAKADVHAKNKVRGGGGGAGVCTRLVFLLS